MPSGVVHYFTVVEIVAGFLTRIVELCVTIAGYSDLRKTSIIHIVLSDFPHCQCLYTDTLEGSDVPMCYMEVVHPA